MPKFKPKAVSEVDAMQWTGDNLAELIAFCGSNRINVTVLVENSWKPLQQSQWVVKNPDNSVKLTDDADFTNQFDPKA